MLTRAIQLLPDRCRQISSEKVYGCPNAAAKELNISPRTVNAQISIEHKSPIMSAAFARQAKYEYGGSKPSDFNEARIKQEASDWVAKHDCGLSAEEQDAFFEWLAENPAHSEAYSRRQIVWKEMNVLADWRPEHSEEPNPDLLAVSPAKSKVAWYWAVAGFAALLAVGLFIGSNLRQSNQSDRILLASGESAQFYEYHVLEDGSVRAEPGSSSISAIH